MPKSEPRPKMPKRDAGTMQIRTIARRAGYDVNHLLVKLRSAKVQAIDGGPLYAHTKVDIDAAMKALAVQAENRPAEQPLISKLADDAGAAKKQILDATPTRPYSGDENQPVPQFILEGADPATFMDFPPIANPDRDKVYYPVNVNADRQHRMMLRGFRFVVDTDHIRRIGGGILERFVNARGRVQYKDRELAYMPIDLALKRRAERARQFAADRAAVDETFAANVEAAKRAMGRGADTKLAAFEMSEGEAIERAEHAEAARRGVQRVVLDLGASPAREAAK